MIPARAALTGTVVLFVVGCRRAPPQPQPDARSPMAEGVHRFREAFNQAECRTIHEEGSTKFQELQPLERWLGACVEMRADLGVLHVVAVQSSWWDGSGGGVEGVGYFENHRCGMRMWWRIEDGRARLEGLQVERDGRNWSAPAEPRRQWRLPPSGDPPVRDTRWRNEG